MKDELFSDILNEAFGSNQAEKDKIDIKQMKTAVEKVEEGALRVEEKLIMGQMDINNKLVPLMGDTNNLVKIENMTKKELIDESENYRDQLKTSYGDIRNQFREVMNKVRYDELGTFSSMRAQTAQGQRDDPYINMQNEIKRLDEEQKKTRKVRFGFVTSRSMDDSGSDVSNDDDGYHSQGDPNNAGKENESMISLGGKTYQKLSMGNSARKTTKGSLTRKSSKKRDNFIEIAPLLWDSVGTVVIL